MFGPIDARLRQNCAEHLGSSRSIDRIRIDRVLLAYCCGVGGIPFSRGAENRQIEIEEGGKVALDLTGAARAMLGRKDITLDFVHHGPFEAEPSHAFRCKARALLLVV